MGGGELRSEDELARLRAPEKFGFRMRWLLVAASAVLVVAFPPRDPWPMAVALVLLAYNLCGWWVLPRITTPARARAAGFASLALLNVYAVAISFSYSYIPESPGWLVFYFLPMSAALRFGLRASVPQALAALAIDAGARYYAQSRFGVDVDVAALVLRGCVYLGIAVFAGVWAETVTRQRRALDRAAAESAALYAEAEARAQRLHALTDIQRRRFARALDPGEVYENIAQAAVELLSADMAKVWVPDGEGVGLTAVAEARGEARGGPVGATGDARLPAAGGPGIDGVVRLVGGDAAGVAGGQGAGLDDAAARGAAGAVSAVLVGPADAGGFAAYAPLRFEGRVVGVLGVAGAGGRPGQEQLDLLDALAASGAIAVDNARLFRVWGESQAIHRLDQLKSEFVGTISHELRTPLTAILGLAEVLATMPAASGTVRVAASEMLRSSEVMARLVDDLLTFAQFEKGDVAVRREPVGVKAFLAGVVASAARQPGGDRLRIEPGDPSLVVSADPVRLRQVMSNLLSNALRYAPSGPIAVRYAAVGDAVRIEVADEGPGIGADEQARVWERFYRGRSVAGIAGERATGIGLAVVKALVEAQGGAVGLSSPPAGGATFWLTLPAAIPGRAPAAAGAVAS